MSGFCVYGEGIELTVAAQRQGYLGVAVGENDDGQPKVALNIGGQLWSLDPDAARKLGDALIEAAGLHDEEVEV